MRIPSMAGNSASTIAVVLHGGSGTILRSQFSPDLEQSYLEELQKARDLVWDLLADKATALDAVEEGAAYLEDCPLFNAGLGSVLTANGEHELDAAIMCGGTRMAGAVAGLRTLRHPIRLARKVLQDLPFVFLSGEGAEAFADTTDLERVDPAWFTTPERLRQLKDARENEAVVMDHDAPPPDKCGTIGVVARDCRGNLAAATSTGGVTNKRFGRIGDSPVIGAGTYADNGTCAISCTGYGEEFIRAVVAHDVAARMRYLGESLHTAAARVIHGSLPAIQGRGGLIGVDQEGNCVLSFNTEGMYRAWRSSRGLVGAALFNGK